MKQTASRRAVFVAGWFVIALAAAGCGNAEADRDSSISTPAAAVDAGADPSELTVTGEDDVSVTLTGPLAIKYASATQAQREALGRPLTGDHNAGTRESGVVYQQFRGGVIIAKNSDPGTPAYIVTSGKIRDAWNTERAPDGTPMLLGTNGSAGPLGVPTSDVTVDGPLETVTFEHGEISENTTTGEVTVTVDGNVVPSGLR
ncbi:LGFP repeat-containing protein [Gordonia westfalica]|uniref:LGFP repeat-containing protein n=1 Tax=Gordonia westfalica TaxID=158898 RepID=A0A1H2JRU0_9ACTN|nr:hypothetical protein [Gordonia westfalica]SDU59107.1 LGFP repeat-containing protein [Gordonia westfalica]